MAAQIADRSNAGMKFHSSSKDDTPVVSKLEATRLALAQEQKKRIDAAVARVTNQKESGKRKGLGERTDGIHRSKKSKTVVDVMNDQIDKKNSIARRMVDRFATMPEPEKEEVIEQEPTMRSVSTQQFVTVSTSGDPASLLDTALRETTEKAMSTTTTTTTMTTTKILGESPVQVEDDENEEDEDTLAEDEEDTRSDEEDEEQKSDWDGPTTNFHVKQLGLDHNVDIYAPIAQQEHDVQRVRERIKYMPNGDNNKSFNASSDSATDLDFLPKDVYSQESTKSDTELLSEVNDHNTQVLLQEADECEQHAAAIQIAKGSQTWTKRVFIFAPLFIVAIVVLVLALLFAIDWSQETFQFCKMDAENTEDSDEVFSCASFVETQSLIKSTLRETAENVQTKVQSYFD